MADDLRFERFDKSRHRRDAFDCGVTALNEYFKKTLNQQMNRGVTVGYVLAALDGVVAGYFTLSSSLLMVGVVPESSGLPAKMPLPTVLLGRLAVDRSFHGRGLGKMLLVHAMRIALDTSDSVAAAAIEVNAKDDQARSFYSKFGFQSLRDDRLHMYLPIPDARSALLGR